MSGCREVASEGKSKFLRPHESGQFDGCLIRSYLKSGLQPKKEYRTRVGWIVTGKKC